MPLRKALSLCLKLGIRLVNRLVQMGTCFLVLIEEMFKVVAIFLEIFEDEKFVGEGDQGGFQMLVFGLGLLQIHKLI